MVKVSDTNQKEGRLMVNWKAVSIIHQQKMNEIYAEVGQYQLERQLQRRRFWQSRLLMLAVASGLIAHLLELVRR